MITLELKNRTNEPDWKAVNTPVFQFITAQLEKCQNESLSALLCNHSDR
jgi:hypothetical protein